MTKLWRYIFSQIHDEVALQILMFILGKPNDDSVELAIAFLKECGECLMEISPEGLNSVFGMLLKILGERIVSSRVGWKRNHCRSLLYNMCLLIIFCRCNP